MSATILAERVSRHRLLADVDPRMAKVEIRKPDTAWREALGRVITEVRGALSLKEFATSIRRDERQVSRWEKGDERPHFDAVMAVEAYQVPLVVAIAKLAERGVELETVVRIRRT